MQKIKKIYERSFKYTLLSRFAFMAMRIFYHKIYVRGRENVPVDGPVIFAPNHKNALMDPLLILYSFPHEQVVFMARGDFFNNKIVAKIFRFLKILPVFRMRDGIENLGKNEEPFAEAIDTLKTGHKLCLMPEGQQVEVRRLLPLVKGMFRIGFHAQEQYGNLEGVKIIPVGIEYEDLIEADRNVLIQFGKPIELSKYYDLYIEDAPKAYNELRDELYPQISKLMLNINSKEHYETIYLSTLLEINKYLKAHHLKDNEWNRLEAKQQISAQLIEEEKNDPEKIEELTRKLSPLYATGKRDDVIYRMMQPTKIMDYIKMLLFSPIFVVGAACMLLPFSLIKILMNKFFNIEGFESSAEFVLVAFIPPLFFIIYFLISLIWFPIGYAILIFLVGVPLFSAIAYKLQNLYADNFKKLFFRY